MDAGAPTKAGAAPLLARRGIWQFIADRYDERRSGVGLGLFRIAYGLVLFAEVCQLYYFRRLVFDPVPFVVPAEVSFGPALLAWLIVIACLVLGLFTRTAAICNYLLTLVTFSSFSKFEYHLDYSLVAVNFLLMFIPVERRLSLDSLLEKLNRSSLHAEFVPETRVRGIDHYLLLFFGVGLVYLDSIFYKAVSPMWLNGLGVWLPASLPFNTWMDWSFVLDSKLLVVTLGYVTFLFELLFPFLFWFRRTHPFLLPVGLSLHLGILFAFPIPFFALGIASLYLLLVPDRWLQAVGTRLRCREPRLHVFVDGSCPLCHRTRIAIQHFDVRQAVAFTPLQRREALPESLHRKSEDELSASIWSVDGKGRTWEGVATYRRAFEAMGYARPLSWLMGLPGVRWLAKRVYAVVAGSRVRHHCNEETCSIGWQPAGAPAALPEVQSRRRQLIVNVVCLLLAGALCLQLLCILRSPLATRIAEAARLGSVRQRVVAELAPLSEAAVILLGIQTHGVFVDRHFTGYNHVIALVHVDEGERETWLPLINSNGQAGPYDTGRQWVYFTFRVSNAQLSVRDLKAGIRRVTAFWARKNGKSLVNCRFRVKVKKIDSPQGWEPGFLRRQLSRPWIDVGEVAWRDGEFQGDPPDIELI